MEHDCSLPDLPAPEVVRADGPSKALIWTCPECGDPWHVDGYLATTDFRSELTSGGTWQRGPRR